MPNAGELWREFQNEDSPAPKARRRFVGRQDIRRVWYALLDRALEQDFQSYYILHLHGVGGMGKSTLLRRLRQEMEEGIFDPADVEKLCANVAERLRKKGKGQKPITLQVDFDDPTIATVQDVLTRFRAQIMEQHTDAVFPLFDLALLRLSQKYGKRVPPDEERVSLSDNPVVAFALDVVGDLTGAGLLIKAGQTAKSVIQSVSRKLADRKGCIRRANTEIAQMSAPELARNLPYYFAMDVNAMELPLVCVYVDTYEKMISRAEGAGRSTGFDEKWLWGERGLVKNLGNAVFAVAGREELEAEPSDRLDRSVGPFTQEESEAFLSGCDIKESTVQQELYQLTKGVPFHLELCVEEYEHLPEDQKRNGVKEGLNKTKEWVNERYLRFVPPELWDAVRILCAIGRWNDTIYRELARRMPQLPQEGETGYYTLINLSYVERQRETWCIFRPVAETLAERLDPTLRCNLAKALAETEALDVLAGMKNAPATPQGAAAMERRAERNVTLGKMDEARLWQERAATQWRQLGEGERYLAAAARLTDILDRMALYGERDKILAEGLDFVKELKERAPLEVSVALWERKARYSGTWEEDALARREVLQLYKKQVPPLPDRVVWMSQCRLGWALYGCDDADPETENLLCEALEGLKKVDAAESRSISPYTLYAAEVVCQFAENVWGKPAYGAGKKELLEETRDWLSGQSCVLTGAETLEELRLWQEWLDLNEEKRANIHCGMTLEELYELQKQVAEGLRNCLGEQDAEVLSATQKTVKGYLRAHEKMIGLDALLDEILQKHFEDNRAPLGSERETRLILFEEPEFVIGCCRDLVEKYKLYVGKEHPDTLEAMDLLVRTYAGAGLYREAVLCRWEALEVYAKLSPEQKNLHKRDARRLLSGMVTDWECLEEWEMAARAQKDYLSSLKVLCGDEASREKNLEYGRFGLGKIYLEWLWQEKGLTGQKAAELLNAIMEICSEMRSGEQRRVYMDSAWQWCLENEDLVTRSLWEAVETAWKESGGQEE